MGMEIDCNDYIAWESKIKFIQLFEALHTKEITIICIEHNHVCMSPAAQK